MLQVLVPQSIDRLFFSFHHCALRLRGCGSLVLAQAFCAPGHGEATDFWGLDHELSPPAWSRARKYQTGLNSAVAGRLNCGRSGLGNEG